MNNPGGASGLLQDDFHLAAGGVVRSAFAQEVTDAEDGGQRIVQFVSGSRHHLTHGCEFFFLSGLQLCLLRFGYVASRRHDPADFSIGIKERARARAQNPPTAVSVLRPVFDLSVRRFPAYKTAKRGSQPRPIVRMRSPPEVFPDEILR